MSCSWRVLFVGFFVYTRIINNGTGKFVLEIVAIKNSYVKYASHSLCRKVNVLLALLLDEFFIRTATTITEGPVSVTALVGSIAQFHCAGTGNYLVWIVDGLTPAHPDILARGITTVTLPSSGTVQSNLTVPATSVNNGTTVRCAISVSLFSTPAISNYSTLTVLSGELSTLKHS